MCYQFTQDSLQKFLSGVPFQQQLLHGGAPTVTLEARKGIIKGNGLLGLLCERNRVSHSISSGSSSPSQNLILAISPLVCSKPLVSEFYFSRLLFKVCLWFVVNTEAMELTHVPLFPVG